MPRLMPSIEWFYAKNDQPCGPVSPVELKKFAERGELRAEDLVWREGLGEWIPASKVKGLFDSNGDRSADGDASAETDVAVHDSPAGGEVPARAIPRPPPAAAELPIRSSPAMFVPTPDLPAPSAEGGPPLEPEWEPQPLRHPLDVLADLARGLFDAHFVHSTVVLFRVGGHLGVFLAIVAILWLAVATGAATNTGGTHIPLAATGVLVLLFVQHGARHIFSAAERLDCNVRASLSATGPLDSLGAAAAIAGLALLLGLSGLAVATSSVWPVFLALGSYIVCQFAAIVAWNPRAVGLDVAAPDTPGHEAGAQLCLLGKLLWRLSAVAYGAAMVLGGIAALNAAVHIGLLEEVDPRWLGPEMRIPLWILAAAVPFPLVGYLGFLVCQYLAEAVLAGPVGRTRP
ncbi:MAG: DUF4339 domain-containing protein [Thermoguttaceae bacterium]